MYRSFCLVTAVMLGAACASSSDWWREDLQAWHGAPVSELLDAWGPPLRTLTGEGEATVLVYESVRQMDHRLEELRNPGAPLDTSRSGPAFTPVDRSECILHVEIAEERVDSIRHTGAPCNVVPRDPDRRQVDPAARRR